MYQGEKVKNTVVGPQSPDRSGVLLLMAEQPYCASEAYLVTSAANS